MNAARFRWAVCAVVAVALGLAGALLVRAQEDERLYVTAFEWSPDGEMIAVTTSQDVRVYTVGDGEPRILDQIGGLARLTFSLDGTRLAAWEDPVAARSEGRRTTIYVWDIKTGVQVVPWSQDWFYVVEKATFSSDGQMLAMLAYRPSETVLEGGMILWSLASRQEPIWLEMPPYSPGYLPNAIAFSPDQQLMAADRSMWQMGSGAPFAWMNIWTTDTEAVLETEGVQGREIVQIVFNPQDNGVVATLDMNGVVRFWNVYTGEALFALTLPYDLVDAIAFSPDGQRIATGGSDGAVRVWEAPTGVMLELIPRQGYEIMRLDYTADGDLIAYGTADGIARKWDARTREELAAFALADVAAGANPWQRVAASRAIGWLKVAQTAPRVFDLAWSPDGTRLTTATDSGADFYDVTTNKPEWLWHIAAEGPQPDFPFPGIVSAEFSPDGDWLALGQVNGIVQVWDVLQRHKIASFQANRFAVWALAFNQDGTRLATGGGYFPTRNMGDYEIHVWDTATWNEVAYTKQGRYGEMDSIAYSPDDRLIAYGGINNPLAINVASSGVMLTAIHPEPEVVDNITFSPDGRYLAFRGGYRSVQIWEFRHQPELHLVRVHRWPFLPEWERPEWPLTGVAFTPHGNFFAVGTDRGEIQVRDAETGDVMVSFAPGVPLREASFNPAGDRLATVDESSMIQVWELFH